MLTADMVNSYSAVLDLAVRPCGLLRQCIDSSLWCRGNSTTHGPTWLCTQPLQCVGQLCQHTTAATAAAHDLYTAASSPDRTAAGAARSGRPHAVGTTAAASATHDAGWFQSSIPHGIAWNGASTAHPLAYAQENNDWQMLHESPRNIFWVRSECRKACNEKQACVYGVGWWRIRWGFWQLSGWMGASSAGTVATATAAGHGSYMRSGGCTRLYSWCRGHTSGCCGPSSAAAAAAAAAAVDGFAAGNNLLALFLRFSSIWWYFRNFSTTAFCSRRRLRSK